MKSLFLSIIVLLAACIDKPKPAAPKPSAQFLWISVPGTLADAERMGFLCQPIADQAALRCVHKSVDIYGVKVDAALTISNKNGVDGYDTIELMTYRPTGWERSCSDTVDVDIIMLDGSIKKYPPKHCVRDTSHELDVALVSSGWQKAYQGRNTVYRQGANAVTIKVYMNSPVFSVMRSE